MTGSEGARPSGSNRRTVVKGAAWAVPAVAVGNPVVQNVNQGPITIAPGATVCLPNDVLYCSNSSANFINVTFTVQGQPGTQVISVPSPVQTCRAEDQFC